MTLQESELRERKPEPTELLSKREQEPVWLRLENRLALVGARRAEKPGGQAGHWLRVLLEFPPVQKKLRQPLW